MHKPRPSPYGPEFEQLLVAAFNTPPFRFPCTSPGHAKAFKAKIYGYFRALREEDLRLDLIEMADNLMLTQEESTIVFNLKSESPDAIHIRSVLGLDRAFASGNSSGGNELQVPDLMHTKALRKLEAVRERQKAQTIVKR